MTDPAPSFQLTNVRLADGRINDLRIVDGRFAAAGEPPRGLPVVDGLGWLCLPALVEGHVHLDKTLLGCPWSPFSGGRTVPDRIAAEKTLRRAMAVPVETRAALLVEQEIAFGTGFMRTHVDIDADWGLANLESVVAVRERYRDAITIEIVAFPQSGILASPGTEALLAEALTAGADLIGGLDPASIDGDPVRHLDIVFGLAGRYGKPVDIHLHEGGALGLFDLGLIAERTRALGMGGKVTVSHAFCLGEATPADLGRSADLLARTGIAILTSAPPRAMPPVLALRDAGVTVFAGSDNIRDAWSPFGNGDMLERASLAARQQGLVTDPELAIALDLVTGAAAQAMGIAGYGIAPGNSADFILVDAATVAEAVSAHPARRQTYKRGRLVSGTP